MTKYAFVNSQRLQTRLAELGIRYFHFKSLAPSPAMRNIQNVADKTSGVAKQTRSELSCEFVEAYQKECLATFDAEAFVRELGNHVKVLALFCVEREPAACHRSLVAEKLAQNLDVKIRHIVL